MRKNLNSTSEIYLVQEQDILEGSYFFFYALPTDIESVRIIDNAGYNGLQTNDKTNDSEFDFNLGPRWFLGRLRRLRTGALFRLTESVIT
jgi:hypothetical protein